MLEPVATRDHTERAFHEFGVRVQKIGEAISVVGGQRLSARDLVVPGDVSSATFWIALAAGTPGADIEIDGVGLNPTRTAMIEIARRAGRQDRRARSTPRTRGEPIGRIRVVLRLARQLRDRTARSPGRHRRDSRRSPRSARSCRKAPRCASAAPPSCASRRATASAASRPACGRWARRSRSFPTGSAWSHGRSRAASVDAADDHRLAMAFAIAATGAAQPTTILGASSVDVSYPGFFDALERLTR